MSIPYVPGKEPYVEIKSSILQIAPEGKLMVRISQDGTIEYGPDYKPDEAAIAFWNAMSYYFPAERRVRNMDDGIFWHKCITPGCDTQVEFDDEPWCFTHSPDSGSSVNGWSAKLMIEVTERNEELSKIQHRNVFEENSG